MLSIEVNCFKRMALACRIDGYVDYHYQDFKPAPLSRHLLFVSTCCARTPQYLQLNPFLVIRRLVSLVKLFNSRYGGPIALESDDVRSAAASEISTIDLAAWK